MPRTYVRKNPAKKVVTQCQIDRAKHLISLGLSQRRAAEDVGISECALRKRLKLNTAASSLGNFKTTFSPDQEREIVEYCEKMDNIYYGMTISAIRKLVFQYATVNNIPNRFNKELQMAGRDWVESFLKRHKTICLRQSIATSLARAKGFNKVQVDRFYKNLKELYAKFNFGATRIYNMDETGMSTVPKKTPRVISTRGKKVVGKIVSAERGITVTAVCCMNATGHYVPPVFIFPRKRMKDDLLDGGPSGCIGMVSDSGFINSGLFIKWLQHFKENVHAEKDRPTLLIMDNHSSHISLEATILCRESGISILTLPPHSSHKMQPLDRSFFSPLKARYAEECERWTTQHPGRAINQYQVVGLFNRAFEKAATVGNAASGFSVTGIYPFNENLFGDLDFAPASVTDSFKLREDAVGAESNFEMPCTDITDQAIQSAEKAVTEVHLEVADAGTVESITNNIENVSPNTTSGSPMCINDEQILSISTPGRNVYLKKNEHVSLLSLSPLPKAEKNQKKNRKTVRSEIITSTPYKQDLENKRKEEEEKHKKTMDRRQLKKVKVPMKPLLSRPGPSGLAKHLESKLPEQNMDCFCPLCGGKYEDPPVEEWIQCIKCDIWWHEDCTSYEKEAVFYCDFCCDL